MVLRDITDTWYGQKSPVYGWLESLYTISSCSPLGYKLYKLKLAYNNNEYDSKNDLTYLHKKNLSCNLGFTA